MSRSRETRVDRCSNSGRTNLYIFMSEETDWAVRSGVTLSGEIEQDTSEQEAGNIQRYQQQQG